MSAEDTVYPPREGKTQRIVTSTTGAITPLDDGIDGPGWVRVSAQTANVDVKFGPSTMTQVVKDATGSGVTVGHVIPAGTFQDFDLAGSDTYVSWDADGSGFLEICAIGRRRVRNV